MPDQTEKQTFSDDEALDFHRIPTPGKISMAPTKPMATQRDLSLAYSPGVAVPVLAIAGSLRKAGKGVIQLISDAYLTADDDFAISFLASYMAGGSIASIAFWLEDADADIEGDIDRIVELSRAVAPGFMAPLWSQS